MSAAGQGSKLGAAYKPVKMIRIMDKCQPGLLIVKAVDE